MKHTLVRLGLTALVTSVLFGCGGGSDGAAGTNSVTTINQADKVFIPSNSTVPSSESVLAWRALEPQITVTSVTIASPPVVKFAVTDAQGNAVVGLGNTSQGTSSSSSSVKALTNLRFTLAKLVPSSGTEPSKWVSYLVVKPPTVGQVSGSVATTDSCTSDKSWCGTYPTTDTEGTLVDNGDGTYQYTFKRDITKAAEIVASLVNSTDTLKKKADLGDVSYLSSLTHRLGIQISGAAPGTGTNNPTASSTTGITATNIAIPANVTYDFVPAGGAVASTRDVVDIESCSSCHNGKGLAHGGGRKDPKLCVTCHTDQVKYGMSAEAKRTGTVLEGTTQNTTSVLDGRAIGNFPNMLHKIHMGAELSLTGYNYIPSGTPPKGEQFEKTEWIQDPRNCTKCHSGQDKTDINQATKTKDGDNWLNKPSRLACAACHDNVSFAASVPAGFVAHTGGSAGDDSSCASCHSASGQAGSIAVSHRAEAPTANNPTTISGIANFDYEIKSVTVDQTTGQTTFVFKIKQDGLTVTTLYTGTQLIPGFNSGPTFYAAFAVPQDGIPKPADFNAYFSNSLSNLKAGTNGTLSASPNPEGYWTAVFTAASNKIPVTGANTAMMVTGAMIGNFTQVDFNATKTPGLVDITTDLGKKWNIKPVGSTTYLNGSSTSSGLYAKTPLVQKVATGYTGRRVIVDNTKCQACHEQLGAAVEFHSGARNDATSCAICHNPNRSSSGWSANASTFVHAIHAGTSKTTADLISKTSTTPCTPDTNCDADVGVPGAGNGGAGSGYSTGKRYIPFSWHREGTATDPTWNAAAVAYPGILKRCDSCHVPNAVNFGANGAALLPKLLWSTSAAKPSRPGSNDTLSYSSDTTKSLPRDPVTGQPPHANLLVGGMDYGSGFSYSGSAGLSPAATTTLVESPVSAACFACHDSAGARGHMTQGPGNGVIYGRRGDFLPLTNGVRVDGKLVPENCLECHGMGKTDDVARVHN